MPNLVYEASIYSREISYKNLNGETKTVNCKFALHPLKLMAIITATQGKRVKSGNPALAGKTEEVNESMMLQLIQDLACQAAGSPSIDGETWYKTENFEGQIFGQAFLTKLASSDADREEFAEKVILDPFRSFVAYAKDDASNTPADVQQFESTLRQMERIFSMDKKDETLEDRRARLAAELASLDNQKSNIIEAGPEL